MIASNPNPIEISYKRGNGGGTGDAVRCSPVPVFLGSAGMMSKAEHQYGQLPKRHAGRNSIGYFARAAAAPMRPRGNRALGLTAQLKTRTVYSDGGQGVEFLATGDFEVGIPVRTNIMVGAPGTEYVVGAARLHEPLQCPRESP